MPDWRKLVADKLTGLRLPEAQKQEIVEELASHLEDTFEERRGSGLSDSAAMNAALNEVLDWHELRRRIAIAKREERPMNDRTRKLWLPALASVSAAVIFQAGLAFLSYRPEMLFRSHVSQWMYILWLIAQVACGAIGASLSRRAGGGWPARVGAAMTTSTILLTAMIAVAAISWVVRATGIWRPDFGSVDMDIFTRAIVTGVLIPGVALLLGALPFLRSPEGRAAA